MFNLVFFSVLKHLFDCGHVVVDYLGLFVEVSFVDHVLVEKQLEGLQHRLLLPGSSQVDHF